MLAAATFQERFRRRAAVVRARLALRRAGLGLSLGLALAVAVAFGVWRARASSPARCLTVASGMGALGLLAGLAFARRRRWSDVEVALYLDAKLDADEAITTAVSCGAAPDAARRAETSPGVDGGDPFTAVVVTRACEVLARADARRARPRMLLPLHALALPAAALLVWIARAPLPPLAPGTNAPGTARVQLGDLAALDKAILLGQLDARDDAQRARLDQIAKDAQKLKAELTAGMDKRDAQDKVARLRDAIAAERLSLGQGERRAGLESAVAKLGEHEATKRAARALGDHDLTTMDDQMERLANERERADREAAKQALDDAAAAARKNGAPDVAKTLDGESRKTGERGRRADLLRELSDAMKASGMSNEDLQGGAEALDRKRSDAAARALADAMGKALEALTPEERARLAKKLAEQAHAKGTSAADADALKDLSDALSTAEGEKKLADELRDMANADESSEEARRERALDDAERGADGAQGQLGGAPGPGSPGEGQSGGPSGQGASAANLGAIPLPGQGGADGAGHGGSHDTGTGNHAGSTGPVSADTLRSRAKGPLSHGASMSGTITAYTPGKAGGTANTRGTGDLSVVGPSEVDGVDRSDVPEEYREHVRKYFQP